MPEFLVFRLYGSMVAWGEPAVGESRHTAAYPSKSAVCGLLAAALGIRRQEEAAHRRIAGDYGMGVKVVSTGSPVTDYHTIQVPPATRGREYRTRRDELAASQLNTILSSRDYRCDALAVVALWARTTEPAYELEALAGALRSPGFVLYLGRKSCPPSMPLEPRVVPADSLRGALNSVDFVDIGVDSRTSNGRALYAWESTEHSGMRAQQSVVRHDVPISRRRWQFATREEFQAFEDGEQ